MMGWSKTPLELAFDKVFVVFGIDESIINCEDLPQVINDEQRCALLELENSLRSSSKKELEKLEPVNLFTETTGWSGGYAPATLLYDYKANLTSLAELIVGIEERAQIKFAQLSDEVGRVLRLIEDVSEEYAKGVFASKLKYFFEKKGITQKEVASQLLISQQSVSLWLKGKGYPNIPVLIALASLLETSLDFLLRPDGVEITLEEEKLYQTVGLSSTSTKKLKDLVKNEKIDLLTTLNTIIEHKDLLATLTEYFKMPCDSSLSVVPFKELLDLQTEIQMADCGEDAIQYAKGFLENYINLDVQGFRKYQLDKIMIIEIVEILTRIRDEKIKETY